MSLNRLAVVPATALALALAGAVPASASPAKPKPLLCTVSMSNSKPADYTTTDVLVRTAALAKVTTVAHYKTTNHQKTAKAGVNGRVSVPYEISRATPGFKVKVTVTVSESGQSGSCSTSFTPHR